MNWKNMIRAKLEGFRQYAPGTFVWSSYWGTWDKVLAVEGFRVTVVQLTTVPHCHSSTWEEVGARRTHCTGLSPEDKVCRELPTEIVALMERNLGREYAHKLINS